MNEQQDIKDEMTEDTLDENDVHSLLSFTNLVQAFQSTGLEKQTELSNQGEPRQYAIRKHPWRLAKCLDALANICVSEPHQVLATSLRYGVVKNQKMLEIIIAGNDNVSEQTVNHLKHIWGLLRRISQNSYQKTGSGKLADLIAEFETAVLKFTYTRLQNKLFENIDLFRSKKTSIGGQKAIEDTVLLLDKILRQDSKTDKPLSAITDEGWTKIRMFLSYLSQKVSEHLPKLDDMNAAPLVKYLRKIGGIAADLKHLSSAACSPRYASVFRITPNIIALEKMEEHISSFPTSNKAWRDQMTRSLSYYNRNLNESEKQHANHVFQKDCRDIAKKHHHAPEDVPVHCEIKLALHLFREETTPEKTKPAAYPYIGTSKLTCPGCSSFLVAFNKVHGTKFLTKGQHGKVFFPWGVPKFCPKAGEVLEKQYEELNSWFVPWYGGFSKGQDPSPSRAVSPIFDRDRLRKMFVRPAKRVRPNEK